MRGYRLSYAANGDESPVIGVIVQRKLLIHMSNKNNNNNKAIATSSSIRVFS